MELKLESDETEWMPSTLRELHRLEEETEGAERKSKARERTE